MCHSILCPIRGARRNNWDLPSTYAYVYLLIVATEVIKLENLIKIFTVSILSLCLPCILTHSRRAFTLAFFLSFSLSFSHSLPYSYIRLLPAWPLTFVSWCACMGHFLPPLKSCPLLLWASVGGWVSVCARAHVYVHVLLLVYVCSMTVLYDVYMYIQLLIIIINNNNN